MLKRKSGGSALWTGSTTGTCMAQGVRSSAGQGGSIVSSWVRRLHPQPCMPDSNDPEADDASPADPVDAARRAIWRLFEEGQIDTDRATDALLAIDVGTQRTRRRRRTGAEGNAGAPEPP